jgi:hypothetical protein
VRRRVRPSRVEHRADVSRSAHTVIEFIVRM